MSKRTVAAAAVTETLRGVICFLSSAWIELLRANLVEQAAAVERALAEILRASCLGQLFSYDRETAFIVRADTPEGRVELLAMTPLD